jgi:hypothetical protein
MSHYPRFIGLAGAALLAAGAPPAASAAWAVTEIGGFQAAEAHQAVAVDAAHFYAVDDAAIGKYAKTTGAVVARWAGAAGGPITHLNSAVAVGGELYCAHSNYPQVPSTSSIEIWDTATLTHVRTHGFGPSDGWATWIDHHDRSWWVVFAHYGKMRQATGKDARATSLVRFDETWRPQGRWGLPPQVLERFGAYSSSGGSWGPGGLLYLTGHDRREIYAVRVPAAGAVLELVEIIAVPIPGQGIAWDRSRDRILYGLDRPQRRVVVLRIGEPGDSRDAAGATPARPPTAAGEGRPSE